MEIRYKKFKKELPPQPIFLRFKYPLKYFELDTGFYFIIQPVDKAT